MKSVNIRNNLFFFFTALLTIQKKGINLFRKKMSPWKFYNTGTGYPTKPSTALLSAFSLAQPIVVVHPDS